MLLAEPKDCVVGEVHFRSYKVPAKQNESRLKSTSKNAYLYTSGTRLSSLFVSPR